MDERRREKKTFVRNIRTKSEYESFMSDLKLTECERKIADMVFLRGCDYRYIGDALGYSEATVKRKMKRILDML